MATENHTETAGPGIAKFSQPEPQQFTNVLSFPRSSKPRRKRASLKPGAPSAEVLTLRMPEPESDFDFVLIRIFPDGSSSLLIHAETRQKARALQSGLEQAEDGLKVGMLLPQLPTSRKRPAVRASAQVMAWVDECGEPQIGMSGQVSDEMGLICLLRDCQTKISASMFHSPQRR
jgi:hypothetical protein